MRAARRRRPRRRLRRLRKFRITRAGFARRPSNAQRRVTARCDVPEFPKLADKRAPEGGRRGCGAQARRETGLDRPPSWPFGNSGQCTARRTPGREMLGRSRQRSPFVLNFRHGCSPFSECGRARAASRANSTPLHRSGARGFTRPALSSRVVARRGGSEIQDNEHGVRRRALVVRGAADSDLSLS